MLNDTTGFPTKAVHNFAKRALVVEPGHLAPEFGSEHRDVLGSPERAQEVQGILRPIFSQRVVVLSGVLVSQRVPIEQHAT